MTSIRPATAADTDAVVLLWQEAGLTRPWNDPVADIGRKLQVDDGLFVVAEDADGAIVGTVMAGYDGHRGWIHYLGVRSDQQGTGLGATLVEQAEDALLALGCAKVQLQVRPENSAVLGFYERLGYAPYDAISLGKRLVVDDPSSPRR